MKKKLFLVCAALMCTVALMAQNISVVSSGGSTKLYRTLEAAIKGADPNSVIYLPGGGFPIADSVKITKKLTIIGIGHKAKNENADGITLINGNLFFNEGSSDSAVMGCYITGDINIGEGGAAVNDILIRYCNLNAVSVKNSICQETVVNQNYIRGNSNFGSSGATFTNNIASAVCNLKGGIIKYNYIKTYSGGSAYGTVYILYGCDNSTISNNIFPFRATNCGNGIGASNIYASDNMGKIDLGDNFINMSDFSDLFVNDAGITPASDFHFTEAYNQYSYIGPYSTETGSTGFNDKQLAPAPYIVAKHIDDHTDASGKLNIKIRVKASGEE